MQASETASVEPAQQMQIADKQCPRMQAVSSPPPTGRTATYLMSSSCACLHGAPRPGASESAQCRNQEGLCTCHRQQAWRWRHARGRRLVRQRPLHGHGRAAVNSSALFAPSMACSWRQFLHSCPIKQWALGLSLALHPPPSNRPHDGLGGAARSCGVASRVQVAFPRSCDAQKRGWRCRARITAFPL